MFNIGPFELMILAIIGVVILGPERLPGLARDAAQMLRTLRDLATGARQQLRDELGPEFADVDLRNLNPRTALTRAVFGDEEDLDSLRRMDPRRWNAREAARDFVSVPDEGDPVSFDKGSSSDRTDVASGGALNGRSTNGSSSYGSSSAGSQTNGSSANGSANGSTANGSRPRPRPRPGGSAGPTSGPSTPYDSDAT